MTPETDVVVRRFPYTPDDWEGRIAGHPDLEVFHGTPWLDYLRATQGAEPVVAEVLRGGQAVGVFVGAIVRRYGLRILGSPLRGWATQAMGFLLDPGVDRRAAAEALAAFCFRDLGCAHLELADRNLAAPDLRGTGYRAEAGRSFEVDLARPESEILAGLRPSTRNYLRQAGRKGLTAEVATGTGFADEYHAQLAEVFSRQGLVPTYGVERVRALIQALEPSGQVLLLRVRDPDGDPIATSISVGRNRTAILWGAAFRRAHSQLHPNELLHWETMRYWQTRGIARYDMGGGGEYKAKYGSVEISAAHFHRSRMPLLTVGRAAVRTVFRARQILAGRIGHRPAGSEP